MAFEATKKEWCELYSFFRLLADGKVVLGTAEAKAGDTFWPVAMIQREEHDGTRQYYIEEDTIRIEGENGSKSMPREDFGIVADLILQAVKSSPENDVASLRVFMATLRKKLEPEKNGVQYIQTHIGIGYRMLRIEKPEQETNSSL